MIEVLFIVGGFCLIIGLLGLPLSEAKFLSGVGAALLVWAGLACSNLHQNTTEDLVDINIVEDIAVVIIDGKLININDRMNQNFEDHTQLKVIRRSGAWSVGVWFPETFELERIDSKAC